MVVITVEIELESALVERFRTAILQQARNSLAKEPGCKQFDVCFDPDDPGKCFLYEKYVDSAAFAAHRQTEHFADYSETVHPCIKSKSVSTWVQSEC